MKMRYVILAVAMMVASFGYGWQVGQREGAPGDDDAAGSHNGGFLPSAAAAPLTWNLATSGVASAKLAHGLAPTPSNDLIQARGHETYHPSAAPPTGTPDEAWFLFYMPDGLYRSGFRQVIDARVDNDGTTKYDYHVLQDAGVEAFWESHRMGDFLVDSTTAVSVLHAAGGALAASGHDVVEIDYQLMSKGGAPTWDIVYRDTTTGVSLFTGAVDAMTGVPVALEPSFPPMGLFEAIQRADPQTRLASDAVIAWAMAPEGDERGLAHWSWPARRNADWGLPVSTMELNMTDGLTSTWYLAFYSPSLNETMLILVVGDETPVGLSQNVYVGYKDVSTTPPVIIDIDEALQGIKNAGVGRNGVFFPDPTLVELWAIGTPIWVFYGPDLGGGFTSNSINANTGADAY